MSSPENPGALYPDFVQIAAGFGVAGRRVIKKAELRAFIEMLDDRDVVTDRDTATPDSFLDSLRPLGWLRRAIGPNHDRR